MPFLLFCTRIFLVLAVSLFGFESHAVLNDDDRVVYKNSAVSVEMRVKDLLNRMTLSEKLDLISGDGFTSKRNNRLGIPEIVMTDGPLGPNGKGRATNYSACINMAATWDDSLINRVAVSMGRETRELGYNMLLGPCLNIARVPHGGRTFESFGEDPYLMSRMARAYIIGVQSQRVIACAKHFAVNNQEWNRGTVDVRVDDRTLHEIYFPAFKAAVQEAGVWSIMAAYNKFRGEYCCSNHFLLTTVLKEQWGFDGFVVSDWGGVHNIIQTALSGLDLEMPNGQYFNADLQQAVTDGKVNSEIIEDKVRRILRIMFRAGLFDETITDVEGSTETENRRLLALEVANKSIVLLKNDKTILPLDRNKIKSIALIGPNADQARMYGGGSGFLPAHYSISPLQGLREKIGDDRVRFVRCGRMMRTSLPAIASSLLTPPQAQQGEHGLLGEYYNNRDLEGRPVLSRIDRQIDFNWDTHTPAPGVVNSDSFSVRWTGTLTSPGSGIYELGVMSDNGCRLYVDGNCLIDSWTTDLASSLRSVYIELDHGRSYDIRVEFFENLGTSEAHLGLAYYGRGDEMEQALAAAREADVAVICAGLCETLEGEGTDRKQLALPEDQVHLIQATARVNENCIVVLYNATPVLMNGWIEKVPAVLEAFYPGQEGGHALADILFGDVNPSGKLPLTCIRAWEDSPVYQTYPGHKDFVTYSEGLFVGYRHFDKYGIEPLYPFGHGLSYTEFKYGNMQIIPCSSLAEKCMDVMVDVQNVGETAGDEIVQLYIQNLASPVDRAVKLLKGFERVSLKPGECRTVTFRLGNSSFSHYDDSGHWLVKSGKFKVLLGSSSRDIRLERVIMLE